LSEETATTLLLQSRGSIDDDYDYDGNAAMLRSEGVDGVNDGLFCLLEVCSPHPHPCCPPSHPRRTLVSERNLYFGTSRLRGAGPFLILPLVS